MQRAEYQSRLTEADAEVLEQAPGNAPGDVVGAATKALDAA
jgi:hypothetical protein